MYRKQAEANACKALLKGENGVNVHANVRTSVDHTVHTDQMKCKPIECILSFSLTDFWVLFFSTNDHKSKAIHSCTSIMVHVLNVCARLLIAGIPSSVTVCEELQRKTPEKPQLERERSYVSQRGPLH